MKRELDSATAAPPSDLIPPPPDPATPIAARPRFCNGLVVYTRNKKLKSSDNNVANNSKNNDNNNTSTSICLLNNGESKAEHVEESMVTSSDVCLRNGGLVKAEIADDVAEMVEVEVKLMEEEEENGSFNVSRRRMNRFESKSSVRRIGVEREEEGEIMDVVVRDAGGNVDFAEGKESKKRVIRGRPSTVIELFETGLLEDYPVFYNGGKKGILLRGTVKDIGILCFCNFCQGAKVITPSQFEIHAIKTYKRASQYICLENGKSLLDIVKECSKCSIKALQEKIQTLIGPMPEMESIVCRNCKESFWATSTAPMDQVCNACVIHIRRETNAIRSWREFNPVNVTSVKESVAIFKAPESVPVDKPENADKHMTPKRSRRGRKKKKFLELATIESSRGRSSVHISSRVKVAPRGTERLPKPALVPIPTGSILVNKLVSEALIDSPAKISHRSLNSISSPSYSRNISSSTGAQWKMTKKDQKMHKLVFEEGGLPDGTEVAYYSHGKKLLEGYKKGGGIFCFCCSSEVRPSTFEAHAGWASRKKPYGYIYTSNGVSLHEFALSLLKGRKCTAKDSDDLCIICADGGKLVLCDGCPRAFHRECASLSSIPRGKWYCKYCHNMFQREKHVEYNENALAAGRVTGIDPIEQITKRLIRTVKNPEEVEVIACVICRGYDFSKSGFGPRTVILCDQCEKEYHIGCLKKTKVADLKELPKGKWFCSTDCKRIHSALEYLLSAGAEKLPDSCLEVINNKHQNQILAPPVDLDVRWRLLSGKVTSRDTRLLLSEAVAIFHECFDPIVDSVTGRDFIPSMVYGRNIRGQDFSGVYCAILTVNSSVVSAGILRIFGQDFAELPLVATHSSSQGKGYFQVLFSCIEKLLAFLNVRTFVLPAADGAESIWINKFGFRKIPPVQLFNYRKTCWQMVSFKGTSMLEKTVPRCRIIGQDDASSEVLEQ